MVNEIIFCDISINKYKKKQLEINTDLNVKFINKDAWIEIRRLSKIDLLFYRRDGMSEGGSGIEVLQDDFLSLVLKKFPKVGGSIITDGSNANRDYRFKNMCEKGLELASFKITKSNQQPFSSHNLTKFDVHPNV